MDRAIQQWLAKHKEIEQNCISHVFRKLQKSYVIYGSMILLPSDAIDLLENQIFGPNDAHELYELIARHLKITHIATTRPIPLYTDSEVQYENKLRSPSNFRPLYGDFGPLQCSDPPSQSDFAAAYWVTAKQNGIHQTWSPRWTMFSRGNVSEKARILSLPSVIAAVNQGNRDGKGCAAVDLYAGIGYFAFSYLKAGVMKVLCWDLNPWSVEGLMRGAKVNKWPAVLAQDELALSEAARNAQIRVMAFHESNDCAFARIQKMKELLPPIRHVNCGLLPTSRESWDAAVGVLDEELGGWIHIHENFGLNEIETKAEDVRSDIQRLVDQKSAGRGTGTMETRKAQIDHISRLKSYAPGVMHCVLDIYIHPIRP
ncbi:hypothetical protein M433DRAFT_143680 [Acidomyces richmondensis BFW]|nr:MAG: hypothetical protein FE78DRAFT_167228 [Acidomyces sp. 'richmondensis']KYG45716.1 hypothetical protein M433DRAFT_143680 [Acidomyces richmondensis BFW]